MEKNEAERMVEYMAEMLQNECHQMVEAVIKHSKKPVSVQDATNAWLYRKLAELQLEIHQLKAHV